MPEDLETRTVMTPRTGTKICILIGLAFIVLAVYFYFVPVTDVRTTTGSIFGCGTASNPSSSTFAKGTCWRATDVEKYRAIASAAIGVLTIVLGAVMFGVDRRTETRPVRRSYEPQESRRWDDDDDRRGNDEDRRRDRDEDQRRRDDRRQDRDESRPDDDRDAESRDDADDRETVRPRSRVRRDWDDDRS